tara:strand:+ start:28109 stop:29407 length:1299 start_codon:yes stop_codon:yes gene_type:complete
VKGAHHIFCDDCKCHYPTNICYKLGHGPEKICHAHRVNLLTYEPGGCVNCGETLSGWKNIASKDYNKTITSMLCINCVCVGSPDCTQYGSAVCIDHLCKFCAEATGRTLFKKSEVYNINGVIHVKNPSLSEEISKYKTYCPWRPVSKCANIHFPDRKCPIYFNYVRDESDNEYGNAALFAVYADETKIIQDYYEKCLPDNDMALKEIISKTCGLITCKEPRQCTSMKIVRGGDVEQCIFNTWGDKCIFHRRNVMKCWAPTCNVDILFDDGKFPEDTPIRFCNEHNKIYYNHLLSGGRIPQTIYPIWISTIGKDPSTWTRSTTELYECVLKYNVNSNYWKPFISELREMVSEFRNIEYKVLKNNLIDMIGHFSGGMLGIDQRQFITMPNIIDLMKCKLKRNGPYYGRNKNGFSALLHLIDLNVDIIALIMSFC